MLPLMKFLRVRFQDCLARGATHRGCPRHLPFMLYCRLSEGPRFVYLCWRGPLVGFWSRSSGGRSGRAKFRKAIEVVILELRGYV